MNETEMHEFLQTEVVDFYDRCAKMLRGIQPVDLCQDIARIELQKFIEKIVKHYRKNVDMILFSDQYFVVYTENKIGQAFSFDSKGFCASFTRYNLVKLMQEICVKVIE